MAVSNEAKNVDEAERVDEVLRASLTVGNQGVFKTQIFPLDNLLS